VPFSYYFSLLLWVAVDQILILTETAFG
jgi:hypothetical protein